MDKIEKLKSISTIPANAEADIELINQYSVKELTSQDVFCFSVILCDNEVDRDMERFTNESLDKLAPLFLGKTVLFDHCWSADEQIARIYRTFVEEQKEKTSTGEQKKVLRGSVYMLRTEGTAELIKAIEGGIKKELSVGCSMKSCACSICGETLSYQWQTGKEICKNDHIKGDTYEGKMCFGELNDPNDAYEVSFVAVPAQKGARVTKSNDNGKDIVEFLKTSDLSTISAEDKKDLIKKLQMSLADDDELTKRAKLIAENKKYLEGKK